MSHPNMSSTPFPSPSLSSTIHPSPSLSNISMVPPLERGISPPASPVSLAQEVDAGIRADCVQQGEVKDEVIVDTVERTGIEQDDLKVRSEECLNIKCQVTIMELSEKLAKSKRLVMKHEKMLQVEKEQVRLLNRKIKLLEDEQLQQHSSQ